MKAPRALLALLLCLLCSLWAGQAVAKTVVLRPSVPTNRLVVFFHGSGGYASNIIEHPALIPITNIFLRRGFAVAASDAHGPQTWGSPESVVDYVHLIHRLGYPRVFLFGGSMGGLATMQVIGRVHPEAVALEAPVCNLRGVPLLEAAVSMRWGQRRPAYLSPVGARPYPGLPVKIWASPEDTWVPKDRNADFCARELRRGGARVTEVATAGEHTNTHAVAPAGVPNFFSAVSRLGPKHP